MKLDSPRPGHRKKLAARTKEEKRIYVVVAKSVTVGDRRIWMETGRMAAQACHATGMYRAHSGPYRRITTIVLEARNSKEMSKIITDLGGIVEVYAFLDENPEFYGTPRRVLTAICTEPVVPSKIDFALGHLELM